MTDAAAEAPTIALTDKAAAKILDIRANEKIPAQQCLRIAVHGGGCAGFTYDLRFDDPKPDIDQRFSLKGVEIIVDSMSLTYLAGSTLDWTDGLSGRGFKIDNPNATGTCGCGSSFSA